MEHFRSFNNILEFSGSFLIITGINFNLSEVFVSIICEIFVRNFWEFYLVWVTLFEINKFFLIEDFNFKFFIQIKTKKGIIKKTLNI